MDYIDRIKQIKSQRKITNDMLSEMTGIPLGTLSKILAGFSESPKLSNIVAICQALGCSLDYIISGTPENDNNYTLEAGEIRLVESYRKLDTHGRELCALVMEKELQRVTCSEYETEASKATVLSGEEMYRRIAAAKDNARFGKRSIMLYDLPVSAGPEEATAIGNLMMQAITLGEVANVGEARQIIADSFPLKHYVPTADRAAWDEAYQKFCTLN